MALEPSKQMIRVFCTSHVLGRKSVLQFSVYMAFCGLALCRAELVFCNNMKAVMRFRISCFSVIDLLGD